MAHTTTRRTFIKSGAALFAGAAASGFSSRIARTQGNPAVVYENDFIPPGAACRAIFLSDHHYWPDHPKDWGDGSQMARISAERMKDLVNVLNEEKPDLSIHGGDVIDGGGAFFPTEEEYIKQLNFEKKFLDSLNHKTFPLIGNHETLEGHYTDVKQLDRWVSYFGPRYRSIDIKNWRFIGLDSLLPNPGGKFGGGNVFRNVFGIDDEEMSWLKGKLREAKTENLNVLLFAHVPPVDYENISEFESLIAGSGCVRGMICGHWHRNYLYMSGGIPVMVRIANGAAPLGYSALYLYENGRIIVKQKSQHFPNENYVSGKLMDNPQGSEQDRYLTLYGESNLPLTGLSVFGQNTKARISDGRLALSSGRGLGGIVIDSEDLEDVRLQCTLVKTRAARIGALAFVNSEGAGGMEAALTPQSSTDGQMYIAERKEEGRNVLDRSWFSIDDNIEYRLDMTIEKGRIKAAWKNMPELNASVSSLPKGKFGVFVENGGMLVTHIRLEKLS